MILIIDNYDSFVYNLARYVVELGFEVQVKRCDEITLEEIDEELVSHLILSPGPGEPESAGISIACVLKFKFTRPILGVCLGHQAIARAFGGKVVRAPSPMHGRQDTIVHKQVGIFKDLPTPMQVGRYHSLTVEDLPQELVVTARNNKGMIMAIQHQFYPVFGLQFHPESILTEHGKSLIKNFLLF